MEYELADIAPHKTDYVGIQTVAGFDVQIADHVNHSRYFSKSPDKTRHIQADAWSITEAKFLPQAEQMPLYMYKLWSLSLQRAKDNLRSRFPFDENMVATEDFIFPSEMLELPEKFRHRKKGFELRNDSTASVALISKEGIITTAYVGDSPINFFGRDSQTGELYAHQLQADVICEGNYRPTPNWDEWHNNNGELFFHPVEREITFKELDRTGGDVRNRDFLTVPGVQQFDIKAIKRNPDDECFICVRSDGVNGFFNLGDLRGYDPLVQLGDIFARDINWADWMCRRSLANGLDDNQTVLVTRIPENHGDICLAVADGSDYTHSALVSRGFVDAVNELAQANLRAAGRSSSSEQFHKR